MEDQKIVESVEKIIEPYLDRGGYELYEVTYRREGKGWVLRITVDRKEGGITVKETSYLAREISALLDSSPEGAVLFVGPYHLEISSPGLFRELKTPKDFQRSLGKRVRVLYKLEPNQTREVVGTLVFTDPKKMVLQYGEEKQEIPFQFVLSVHLQPELHF